MSEGYKKSDLWKNSLESFDSDPHSNERELLRTALIQMRQRVKSLVDMIPSDCRELTLHDLSHLDALWDMASLVAGKDYVMNPAEAFVFGASVLIHDAGLTAAAYPKGCEDLTKTSTWRDIAYATLRKHGISEVSEKDLTNPPAPIRNEVLFNVLRTLHAERARELAISAWKHPSSGEEHYLLENAQLRQAYGESIGRIAQSHHWETDRLAQELNEAIGAATCLPKEWAINELKIACLLRCADITHVDERRAPSMLYSLVRPSGYSDLHWNFQNKLNQPTLDGDTLIYVAGSSFKLKDAPAWWLCYEVIRAIDGELSSSNALLHEFGLPNFAARRVQGAESPRTLQKTIRTKGWTPVDAEIRVSDPAHLAQTLGGRNLYGNNPLVPIRELLQNAVDAVHARRNYEKRDASWGTIRVTLESRSKDKDGQDVVWLHIDDNGIGMSERVLTKPLLDFGKSLWNSPLLQEEFPGLLSTGIEPIGKFGIGFFSVFLIGRDVTVISKKYDCGVESTRALEFSGIHNRPILRTSPKGELPADFSTRVSVKIEDWIDDDGQSKQQDDVPVWPRKLSAAIRRLVSAVDVNIEFKDEYSGNSFFHKGAWIDSEPELFLEEILSTHDEPAKSNLIEAHKSQIRPVVDRNGKIYGRAAFLMTEDEFDQRRYTGLVSVGGFSSTAQYISALGSGVQVRLSKEPKKRTGFSYIGVLLGRTEDAARMRVEPNVPSSALKIWASEQANIIDKDRYRVVDLMKICYNIIKLGGDPSELPFCYNKNGFISLSEFIRLVDENDEIILPIRDSYDKSFEVITVGDLGSNFFTLNPLENFIVMHEKDYTTEIIGEETGREIVREGGAVLTEEQLSEKKILSVPSMRMVYQIVEDCWQSEPILEVYERTVFTDRLLNPIKPRWVLCLKKRSK